MIHSGLKAFKAIATEKSMPQAIGPASPPCPILKAHHSWRNGWKDADTELLELARHNRIVAEGREDKYSDT